MVNLHVGDPEIASLAEELARLDRSTITEVVGRASASAGRPS
jgi:hypothetical protein